MIKENQCRTCANRCDVIELTTGKKVGEICRIRYNGGWDYDPIDVAGFNGCEEYRAMEDTQEPEADRLNKLLNRAEKWFYNIADECQQLTTGNVAHKAATIRGMAIRASEYINKRIL